MSENSESKRLHIQYQGKIEELKHLLRTADTIIKSKDSFIKEMLKIGQGISSSTPVKSTINQCSKLEDAGLSALACQFNNPEGGKFDTKKPTKEQLQSLAEMLHREIKESEILGEMSNEDLVKEALKHDIADSNIVGEMMNRLDPGWEWKE